MFAPLRLLVPSLALTALWASPAAASSMPRVDFGDRPIVGVGVGSSQAWQPGGSLSVDVPLGNGLMAGVGGGTTFGGGLNYDLRLLYRFIEGGAEGPAIAGIVGAWGQPGMAGFQLPGAIAPLVGFGMAYAFNDKIDLRLNLLYSPFFNYGNELLAILGGPAGSGFEVGYRLSRDLELTLGLNGRGDVLGVNYGF